MRRKLCALFLAGLSIFLPTSGLHSEENRSKEERPEKEVEISDEDRQVIQMMDLLELMELLDDMELLEGEAQTVSEDKK